MNNFSLFSWTGWVRALVYYNNYLGINRTENVNPKLVLKANQTQYNKQGESGYQSVHHGWRYEHFYLGLLTMSHLKRKI